jgi:quercetin dioxygenase-like cupin family protein
MTVGQWDSARDGALSEQRLRRKLEDDGYAVSRYVYPPGTHFPEHTHGVDKIDAVVSGRFELVVEDETVVLGPGQWIAVPRGARHSATVLGEQAVISLDAVKRREK